MAAAAPAHGCDVRVAQHASAPNYWVLRRRADRLPTQSDETQVRELAQDGRRCAGMGCVSGCVIVLWRKAAAAGVAGVVASNQQKHSCLCS